MSNQLKKWLSAGLAVTAAVLVTLAACDTGTGPSPEAGSGQAAGIRSMSVAGVPVQTAAGKINVYIPYYKGFNPAALDVSGEVEEGAAVMPQLTGTQNFSRPKTFSVRSADGAVTKYTVTVYALFSGKESLAGLAAYTDWTSGKAAEPDPARPLYIALEGMDFYNDNIPSIEPVGIYGTQPAGASFLARIFGVEETRLHDKVPGYTHDQYIALDLSRYTDTVLQGSQLPLGTHGSPSGPAYYADGPFSRVTSINFPPNLRTLGESLFQGNEVLTEIELPEGLVKIDYAAFAGAKNLKSVKLPSTLKTIGTYAFYGTALESIDLPAGLGEIGSAAFYGTSIKRVTIPASVSVSSGFSGIETLEYADFSKASLYASRAKALSFAGCSGLKEVYLPETLVELDEFPWSFKGVGGKLKKLVVYAPFPPVLHKVSSELSPFTGSFKIYVPDSSVDAYKSADAYENEDGASLGWSQYADKIRPISELGAAQ
jgi:hypothetical protein